MLLFIKHLQEKTATTTTTKTKKTEKKPNSPPTASDHDCDSRLRPLWAATTQPVWMQSQCWGFWSIEILSLISGLTELRTSRHHLPWSMDNSKAFLTFLWMWTFFSPFSGFQNITIILRRQICFSDNPHYQRNTLASISFFPPFLYKVRWKWYSPE